LGATNDAIPEERHHLERGRPRPHSDCSPVARNNSKYQAEEQAKYQAKNRQKSRQDFACYARRNPQISWKFRIENRRENFSRKKIGAGVDVSIEVLAQIAGD
jgi:hypothetical protein